MRSMISGSKPTSKKGASTFSAAACDRDAELRMDWELAVANDQEGSDTDGKIKP